MLKDNKLFVFCFPVFVRELRWYSSSLVARATEVCGDIPDPRGGGVGAGSG